ncbi:MAG: VWA domain-containing protein [Sedimentisphaerales bacterium]|nr:VWA domain-containing protein [Sedimentisphaerales bacterium]
MIAVRLLQIKMLYLLWAIPLFAAVFLYAARRRRRALAAFAACDLLEQINIHTSGARRLWKAAAILAAVGLTAFALTRPGWNIKPKTIERRGRDVAFLLDVSKSMLADDLKPNRLEHAKLAIRDCLERLEGDRVALVAFAGAAAVKCPLTLDYGFFGMMLDDISVDSIERGGTHIGDAVRKSLDEVFDDLEKQYKDIILITDGEDHDSFPEQAATEAGERGIRLIAVGLGDEQQGRRIPIVDESGRRTFLKNRQQQEVWSRLDADTLRRMVNATPGGQYYNVATGTMDLGSVYEEVVASAEAKQLQAKTIEQYEEKFQIFLALAFGLLCLETIISERKRRPKA